MVADTPTKTPPSAKVKHLAAALGLLRRSLRRDIGWTLTTCECRSLTRRSFSRWRPSPWARIHLTFRLIPIIMYMRSRFSFELIRSSVNIPSLKSPFRHLVFSSFFTNAVFTQMLPSLLLFLLASELRPALAATAEQWRVCVHLLFPAHALFKPSPADTQYIPVGPRVVIFLVFSNLAVELSRTALLFRLVPWSTSVSFRNGHGEHWPVSQTFTGFQLISRCGGTWNSIRKNLDYVQNAGFTASAPAAPPSP
jgi:hypothetical protein